MGFFFNYSVMPDIQEIIFAMISYPDNTLTCRISAFY